MGGKFLMRAVERRLVRARQDRPQLMRMSLGRLREGSGKVEHELQTSIDCSQKPGRQFAGPFRQEVAVQRDHL